MLDSELEELKAAARRNYVSPVYFAILYVGLGDRDQAFAWLKKSYEERTTRHFDMFKVDPVWDPLRSDPRLQELVRRMGLPP